MLTSAANESDVDLDSIRRPRLHLFLAAEGGLLVLALVGYFALRPTPREDARGPDERPATRAPAGRAPRTSSASWASARPWRSPRGISPRARPTCARSATVSTPSSPPAYRGLALIGHPEERLPSTLSVSFPDRLAVDVIGAAREEVAASAGAACHSGTPHVSATLAAMGVPPERALGAVRLSHAWW